MPEEKRKRCPNWLQSEKMLLLELVEKHFGVIENKKTDATTMKQKHAEWQAIAEEYNGRTDHSSRVGNSLKNQWDFMKKNAKKEEYKRNKLERSNEPGYIKKDDPLHTKIISLIKISSTGFSNSDNESVTETSGNNNIGVIQVNLPEETQSKDSDIDTEASQHTTEAVDSKEAVLQDPLSPEKKEPLKQCVPVIPVIKQSRRSRRRATSKAIGTSIQMLHAKKIKASNKNMVAEKSTDLDLQIKLEQLKQEKLKTRILILDLKLKEKQLNEQ